MIELNADQSWPPDQAYIPPVGSRESIRPHPAEQTGVTANENPTLTAIWFHKGKINYGHNPCAASTIRNSLRVQNVAKYCLYRHQRRLRLSG